MSPCATTRLITIPRPTLKLDRDPRDVDSDRHRRCLRRVLADIEEQSQGERWVVRSSLELGVVCLDLAGSDDSEVARAMGVLEAAAGKVNVS